MGSFNMPEDPYQELEESEDNLNQMHENPLWMM